MKILVSYISRLVLIASLLVIGLGCDSSFNGGEIGGENGEKHGIDEDGDPIIIDPIEDERDFGAGNSFCYGIQPPPPEYNAAKIELEDEYPERHDISQYLPPIGNQGNQGSCVAWATGYYLKSFEENLQFDLTLPEDDKYVLSPSYIFNQIKVQPCDGSVIADALDLLLTQGTPSIQVMPYSDQDCDTEPDELQKELAMANKIGAFFYLDPDLLFEQAKAFLLDNKPVVIAIKIDRNYFGALENGEAVYRKFRNQDGAHAMLVVGYDDSMEAFRVVNSWGPGWGNNGYVWLDYKAFTEATDITSEFDVLCEAWVSNDVPPVLIPTP